MKFATFIFILLLLVILIVVVQRNRNLREFERDQMASENSGQKSLESPTKGLTDTTARVFDIPGGEYERIVKSDGRERAYLLHVPASYDTKKPTELVLFFHGGGGDMYQAAETYGWREKSDAEGFIVAFMNGTSRFPRQRLATWNAGNCCDYARDNNIDDIAYIRQVIEDIKSDFNLKSDAVFATGFSNGGMLMHRLACEGPELVSAVVAVSGTDGTSSCTPKKQIPIMHIHAADDTHVLFNGGAGEDAFRDLSKVADFISVPEVVSRWVSRYGLKQAPVRIYEKDGAYCDRYEGGSAGGTFTLCVTPDGKHSWPGAKEPSRSGAIPTKTLSGTDVVWDFFKGRF